MMPADAAGSPSRQPRAAHLTSAHSPDDVRIFWKECCTLADAGWETHLVAPCDRSFVHRGVSVHGLPLNRGRGDRFLRTGWRVFRVALRLRADVYHIHDPDLLPWAVVLRAMGRQVVYDVHEDVPRHLLVKEWLPRWLRAALQHPVAWAELAMAAACSARVTATPVIQRRFSKKRTIAVLNLPRLSEFPAGSASASTSPVFAYIGTISAERGFYQMLDALQLVRAAGIDATLEIAGVATPPNLLEAVGRHPASSAVKIHGWCDRRAVAAILERSRAGLVVLHPRINYMEAIPVKIFEYMAAGRPIVASDFPMWRNLLAGVNCATFVDPLDPRRIAEAMTALARDPKAAAQMGAVGREAVTRSLNWDAQGAALLRLYEEIVPWSARGPGAPSPEPETAAPQAKLPSAALDVDGGDPHR